MTAQAFADQVSLLVRAIPEIAREDIFALKGGTAINLFVRDLPRLSVDIDLVYLPVADRDSSLQAVRDGLERIASRLERGGSMTVERRILPDGKRLVVQRSEEHTSELQSLIRISYSVFLLKKKNTKAVLQTTQRSQSYKKAKQ